MHGEAPEFKRCCFCVPLRRGLLAWGYTKLVLNLLSIAYMVTVLIWSIRRNRGFDGIVITVITVIMACFLVDLCFDVIFIVASHKKSVRLLNMSYIYNIVWLCLVLLLSSFQMYWNLYYLYRWWQDSDYRIVMVMDALINTGLAFSVIFVQIYLILLIRSEMVKLRKQSLEMQFSNNLASGEPQCTLHNACLADQCVGEKQVVQDCCTGEKQVCCTKEKTPV